MRKPFGLIPSHSPDVNFYNQLRIIYDKKCWTVSSVSFKFLGA